MHWKSITLHNYVRLAATYQEKWGLPRIMVTQLHRFPIWKWIKLYQQCFYFSVSVHILIICVKWTNPCISFIWALGMSKQNSIGLKLETNANTISSLKYICYVFIDEEFLWGEFCAQPMGWVWLGLKLRVEKVRFDEVMCKTVVVTWDCS